MNMISAIENQHIHFNVRMRELKILFGEGCGEFSV